MDFNNFHISGNRNECHLQISYLIIYFTGDVNMMSMSHKLVNNHLLHLWHGLEQLLIDEAINQ